MKSDFPGHHLLLPAELDALWRECSFVFDASALLNLYRYTDSTREDLFGVLSRLGYRLWLPRQAAEEFQRNRPTVILYQAETYTAAKTELQKLESQVVALFSTKRHPFVSDELVKKLSLLRAEFDQDLESRKKQREAILYNDTIQRRVAEIFEGKVGPAFCTNEMSEITEEAKRRFELRIPPGFRDSEDKSEDRKYGDVVLWKQIIHYAKSMKKPIVFITDDAKDDWWWIVKKKRIAAHPELAAEFQKTTDLHIAFYDSHQFLSEAERRLKQPIKSTSLQEVNTVKRARRRKPIDLRPLPVRLEELKKQEAELLKLLSNPAMQTELPRPPKTWLDLFAAGSKTVLEGLLKSKRQKIQELTARIARATTTPAQLSALVPSLLGSDATLVTENDQKPMLNGPCATVTSQDPANAMRKLPSN